MHAPKQRRLRGIFGEAPEMSGKFRPRQRFAAAKLIFSQSRRSTMRRPPNSFMTGSSSDPGLIRTAARCRCADGVVYSAARGNRVEFRIARYCYSGRDKAAALDLVSCLVAPSACAYGSEVSSSHESGRDRGARAPDVHCAKDIAGHPRSTMRQTTRENWISICP
jgi:hypothetical protein